LVESDDLPKEVSSPRPPLEAWRILIHALCEIREGHYFPFDPMSPWPSLIADEALRECERVVKSDADA
jgi:hypothetical protein